MLHDSRGLIMATLGRPREYNTSAEARAAANVRQHEAAAAAGLVQRTVWLPRETWEALRQCRAQDERTDSATLARLLDAVLAK